MLDILAVYRVFSELTFCLYLSKILCKTKNLTYFLVREVCVLAKDDTLSINLFTFFVLPLISKEDLAILFKENNICWCASFLVPSSYLFFLVTIIVASWLLSFGHQLWCTWNIYSSFMSVFFFFLPCSYLTTIFISHFFWLFLLEMQTFLISAVFRELSHSPTYL